MAAGTAGAPATWDLEVDVACVGSGLGAVGAAIAARDQGASCVILEKAPKLGGVCAYGGGEVFVPNNRHMRARGEDDSDEDARRYFEFLSAGYASAPHQAKLLATMRTAVEYFEKEAGVRWLSVKGLPDYYYPDAPGSRASGRYLCVELFDGAQLGPWQAKSFLTPHFPLGVTHEELYAWGGLAKVMEWDYALLGERITKDQRAWGAGMMGWFLKAALVDRGIPAHVGCPVRALVTDERGAVVGVRAEQDGRPFTVRARKGVVLATGGYDHNRDMARMFEEAHDWNSACPPYVHGDHLVMAGEVGAAIASVPATNLAMFFGYHIPGEEHEGVPLYRSSWECGCPHAIWVNAAGERFCDESFYKDYQPRLRAWDGKTQTQPNFQPYLIFDGSYREKYPVGSFLPGQELPEELVVRADTPRELAAKLGIDAAGLERTLTRWNEHARRGEDPDFGKGRLPWANRLAGDPSYPNPNVGPVEKAPFYGMKLVPVGVGINSHGLAWSPDAQVLHVRGHPIPGLYAVGNAAALLDLGGGYQSGTSNCRAITWGYVAGRHAAAQPAG